jgi:hypothetical protein
LASKQYFYCYYYYYYYSGGPASRAPFKKGYVTKINTIVLFSKLLCVFLCLLLCFQHNIKTRGIGGIGGMGSLSPLDAMTRWSFCTKAA